MQTVKKSKQKVSSADLTAKQSILLSLCIILLFLLLLFILFSDNGLADLFSLKSEHGRLVQENERLKQENLLLFRTIERLKNDPEYIESIARKELGMIKKDEVILTPKGAEK
jgi:cell division protein FtsB